MAGSRFRRLVATVVVLVTLTALPWVVTSPAHAQQPLRVLLTGDSITHGRNGDYTWRYRLYKEFQRQGVPVDFVGSRATPYVDPGYRTSSYADPNFDHDHFAKAGIWLRSLAANVGPEVSRQQPDLVVLEAGINDLMHGQTVQQTVQSLRTWITHAQAAKPDLRIVLAEVMRIDVPGREAINQELMTYDSLLPGIASEMSTGTSPITIAHTNRGWEPRSTSYSVDGIHPAPTGETNIAQRVAEALRGEGILPQDPKIFRVLHWARTLRPAVKVLGARAIVSWSRQAITGAKIRMHRLGRRWTTSGPFTSGSRAMKVVRPATYEFRLQLSRRRETGPWGPVTRVHVPAVARQAAPARVRIDASGIRWTPAAGAHSYVVKFHKPHQLRWTTRRTARLQLLVAHVAVARVRAVGPHGPSEWRQTRG